MGMAGRPLPSVVREGLTLAAESLGDIGKCQLYLDETEFPPVERVCDGWK